MNTDDLRWLRENEVKLAGDNPRKRWLANKAYEMRLSPTWGESAMKAILDDTEYEWLPQYIIGRYIVDFFCPRLNLVVEVDGSAHTGNEERDAKRRDWLLKQELNVFRTTNKALAQIPEAVAADLNDWMWELRSRYAA